MKNDIVIAHDKLIELGGSEVILKILVNTLDPKYVITTAVRDKEKWESYLGVKIISPVLFKFIRTDFVFRLLYPLVCCLSKYLKYDINGNNIFIYSSTSVKHLSFYNYNRKILYSNFPLKIFRDKAKYLGERKAIVQNVLLFVYLFLTSKIENATIKKFSNLHVISQDSKDAYIKYYPRIFNDANVGVIHLPVEKILKKRKRKRFVEGNSLRFLLISRLYNEKSVVPFLDEFVSKIGGHSLRVIGTGPLLHKMIQRYAGHNVNFLGFLDETTKDTELREADALIFPTKQEWSMTVIEANVRGLLCFMVNCPASREINTIISGSESTPNIIYDEHIKIASLIEDLNNGYDALEKYKEKIECYFSPKRFGVELRRNLK